MFFPSFFSDPATTESYTSLPHLSLHYALPISPQSPPVAIAGDDAAASAGNQAAGAVEPRARSLSGRGARRQSPISKAGRTSGRRSEEHTSELQPLMRISYAVFCL